MRAAWLATHAVFLSSLHDFTRADECIERALKLDEKDGWVLQRDRWKEALEVAEKAWLASHGAPFAAHRLGQTLLSLGRADEAADRQKYLLDRIPALLALVDQPEQLGRACFKLRMRRLALILPNINAQ